MHTHAAGRRALAGAISLLALTLLALASAGIAAAGEIGIGEVPTETATEVPTEAPTKVPPTEVPGGGVVPPTEAPGPTEGPKNEGVAPGSVVLVIGTSDGGLVPGGTTACVGDVCQTLSSDTQSGFKWEFDRIKDGWHEVRVRTVSPYDGALASVQVFPGQTSRIQVQLPHTAPRDEPPPAQEGSQPPRDNPRVETGTNPDVAVPEGASQFTAVTSLPATGSGGQSQPLGIALLGSLAGFTLLLALAARRARAR